MPMLETAGFYDLPPGKLATVVTYLEMIQRPKPRLMPPRPDLALRHIASPNLDWYRALFRRIGEPWLWFSRLAAPDEHLKTILHDPLVDVNVLERHGSTLGLLELDRRAAGEVELSFFGLVPEALATGAGRWLMERAINLAWQERPKRFWVHTCTFDHSAALSFYIRSGFRPYKQAVEVMDDPRLTGLLPRAAAPHVPLLA